jgi:hypothetical protein
VPCRTWLPLKSTGYWVITVEHIAWAGFSRRNTDIAASLSVTVREGTTFSVRGAPDRNQWVSAEWYQSPCQSRFFSRIDLTTPLLGLKMVSAGGAHRICEDPGGHRSEVKRAELPAGNSSGVHPGRLPERDSRSVWFTLGEHRSVARRQLRHLAKGTTIHRPLIYQVFVFVNI